ncbi:Protein of unknown function [Bacillus mycoides]|nr:Protein of unknown function [Bacillus mycoides]
MRDADNWKV